MKKILIVDDISTFLDKQKSILSRSDFRIYAAMSGEEALEIHKAEKVDLIVTDLDMPGISGDRLCSLIRRDDKLKHVSIIIVCSASAADRARAEKCKANMYITKPVQPAELLEKVSQCLDIPERQSYRVLLKVKVNGKAANDVFFCTSRNISVTGLLIESDRVLEKGSNISCSFFLPNAECISTEAEIMRVIKKSDSSYEYGVRYLNLKPVFRAAIETFIKGKSGRKL